VIGSDGRTTNPIRRAAQDQRAHNRASSVARLREAGIAFEPQDKENILLVVAGVWDFFPGTGMYRKPDGSASGRGVANLIAEINNTKESQ
jgi:hypothetical protein